MGYLQAGFDVVGVDIKPQPNYPFEFIQADSYEILRSFDLSVFDLIHASPPCQGYSVTCNMRPINRIRYPDRLPELRSLLTDHRYIIENVPGAPLINPIKLSGPMFGLRVVRIRLFEIHPSFLILTPNGKKIGSVRKGQYVTVAGNGGDGSGKLIDWSKAMGINWMTRSEIKQAIPPAYTEFLGRRIKEHMEKSQ